jgi:hypothetical protein
MLLASFSNVLQNLTCRDDFAADILSNLNAMKLIWLDLHEPQSTSTTNTLSMESKWITAGPSFQIWEKEVWGVRWHCKWCSQKEVVSFHRSEAFPYSIQVSLALYSTLSHTEPTNSHVQTACCYFHRCSMSQIRLTSWIFVIFFSSNQAWNKGIVFKFPMASFVVINLLVTLVKKKLQPAAW